MGMKEHHWQYNGAAAIHIILQWCEQHLPSGTYRHSGWETISFIDSEALAFFLLRWA